MKKPEIITFKVDEALSDALKKIPNKSQFIREALRSALENVCPLCGGSGILTSHQLGHWNKFTRNHAVEECSDCHGVHLICRIEEQMTGNRQDSSKH